MIGKPLGRGRDGEAVRLLLDDAGSSCLIRKIVTRTRSKPAKSSLAWSVSMDVAYLVVVLAPRWQFREAAAMWCSYLWTICRLKQVGTRILCFDDHQQILSRLLQNHVVKPFNLPRELNLVT
jgi:hypothetical protein